VQVQWFQGFGRFAGGQPGQLGRGGGECRVGFLLLAFGGFDFLFALREVEAPLALGLGLRMALLDVGELRVEAGDFGLHRGTLLVAEQFHAVGAGFELVELAFRFARLFEHLARNLAVDLGAGQFFEQFGAFVGAGVEEGRKAALGEQHGLGEAREIEAGNLGDALQLFLGLRA